MQQVYGAFQVLLQQQPWHQSCTIAAVVLEAFVKEALVVAVFGHALHSIALHSVGVHRPKADLSNTPDSSEKAASGAQSKTQDAKGAAQLHEMAISSGQAAGGNKIRGLTKNSSSTNSSGRRHIDEESNSLRHCKISLAAESPQVNQQDCSKTSRDATIRVAKCLVTSDGQRGWSPPQGWSPQRPRRAPIDSSVRAAKGHPQAWTLR